MFTLNEIVKKVLNKGIVVKVIFAHKERKNYVMLAQKRWLDVFDIETEANFANDDIVDVVLNRKIDLDKLEVLMIQYVEAPKNVTLEDIVTPSLSFAKLGNDFLKSNKEYIKNVSKAILTLRLDFNENLNYHLSRCRNLKINELREIYYLRFFPLTVDHLSKEEEVLTLIKNDVVERFFLHNELGDTISSVQITIPALYKIGVSANQIDNNNIRFIKALKRAWYDLIVEEREKLLIELTTQLEKLNNLKEDKDTIDESRIQIIEYIDLLKEINEDLLESLTTVKEIISFWPPLMQPTPYYLYEG